MIWITLALALREVRRNALRSFLTMLGIVIGVGAVITMVTIGKGATSQVRSEISSLGDNLLMVSPGADRRGPVRGTGKAFVQSDVDAILREVPGIKRLTATAQSSLLLVYGNTNWNSTVAGADNEYLAVRGFGLADGRDFADAELRGGTPVCIIGATVKKELFDAASPLGQQIRVGRLMCPVVGVLDSKGQGAWGNDQDDIVLMPLLAFQRRVAGNQDITGINISVEEGQSTAVVQSQIEALLRERRQIQSGQEDDFNVRSVEEIAEAVSSVTATLTGLLGGIAAVSLLVGGIGIMNIMLVSVTERTREIGTRLAIGALAGEVLMQFLVEAVVLSTLGGVIGIGFGLGLSLLASNALKLPWVVAPDVVLGAFAFSALIGVGFGYLPARKAAQLNPIDALRHE